MIPKEVKDEILSLLGEKPISISEIYDAVHAKYPEINSTQIYGYIHKLLEKGVIRKLSWTEIERYGLKQGIFRNYYVKEKNTEMLNSKTTNAPETKEHDISHETKKILLDAFKSVNEYNVQIILIELKHYNLNIKEYKKLINTFSEIKEEYIVKNIVNFIDMFIKKTDEFIKESSRSGYKIPKRVIQKIVDVATKLITYSLSYVHEKQLLCDEVPTIMDLLLNLSELHGMEEYGISLFGSIESFVKLLEESGCSTSIITSMIAKYLKMDKGKMKKNMKALTGIALEYYKKYLNTGELKYRDFYNIINDVFKIMNYY